MGTVATAHGGRIAKRAAAAAATPGFASAREMRNVLEGALRAVDADERAGSILRATGLRLRFRFPDLAVTLELAASDQPDHHVRWSFGADPSFEPKLALTMSSEVANRYLQGAESLAVAIARGRVRCHGESRTALLYLPAVRLIVNPYRRIVRSEYPHLAVG